MLQALSDWVIIKPIREEAVKANGLILPSEANKVPTNGIVVSIGENVTKVKVGDKVLFKKWETTDITYEDEKYVSFQESKGGLLATFQS